MANEDPSIEALVRAGVSSLTQCDRPCPFCHTEYENINDMHLHVAYHLERFSIFVLPRSHHLEKDEDKDDGEAASNDALQNKSLGGEDSTEKSSLAFESQPSRTEGLAAHSVTAEELHTDTQQRGEIPAAIRKSPTAEDQRESPVAEVNSQKAYVKDIAVFLHERKTLFMRAILDAGAADNSISEGKALETGFEIEPYTGPDLIALNGDTIRPVGYINLRFYFQTLPKTWKLRFLIIPSDYSFSFDIILGHKFIEAELSLLTEYKWTK